MQSMTDEAYEGITALVRDAIGVSFNASKRALVSHRLAPRLQSLGLATYQDYLDLLLDDAGGAETQAAIDLLTTNETYFFREPAHFDLLKRHFLQGADTPVSVWSAASSYGDEAYSIAMLLADLQMQGRLRGGWSVLGTDISDKVLQSASTAVFPVERLRHVAPERLKRYCLRGEGEAEGLVCMTDKLRERVRFGQLNLCEPIDVPGPFDVIFLRNVLIYFDADTKQAVVDRVLRQLRPGGLFFVGMAEGRVAGDLALEAIGPGAFRKPLH